LDAKQETLRPNTFREATRYLLRTWQPFHDRPLDSIVRADVAAQLQIVIKANGRIAAARARSYLAALFTWSMKEGLCDVNPVVATNDPGAGARPRERVLSDLELAAIWNACEADDFGRIVRLLILSGCRRQEIGSLRWSDIDFDSGTITIPGDRTKNHRALSLPLPPVALAILQSTPHRGDHVFGSRGVGFSSWSTSTAAFRRLASPLAPWTLHDLRRTLRTGMGVLGVPPHIAELVIGHAKAGIQAVYDKHRYEPEIKRALALWANHVLAVVEGREQKVVPLRGA
jgi:integrase